MEGQEEFKLLDHVVGFKCMALLLGVGTGRLRKASKTMPDMRHGKRETTSRPGTWTVDAFLRMAYDGTAETLPDKPLIKSKGLLLLDLLDRYIYIFFFLI